MRNACFLNEGLPGAGRNYIESDHLRGWTFIDARASGNPDGYTGRCLASLPEVLLIDQTGHLPPPQKISMPP